jgi:hypothetical protein
LDSFKRGMADTPVYKDVHCKKIIRNSS